MCKLTELDKKIIRGLGEMETKLVAMKLGISTNVIYQHLSKIRRNRKEAQTYINRLNALERMSPRLKRMLTPTK